MDYRSSSWYIKIDITFRYFLLHCNLLYCLIVAPQHLISLSDPISLPLSTTNNNNNNDIKIGLLATMTHIKVIIAATDKMIDLNPLVAPPADKDPAKYELDLGNTIILDSDLLNEVYTI